MNPPTMDATSSGALATLRKNSPMRVRRAVPYTFLNQKPGRLQQQEPTGRAFEIS